MKHLLDSHALIWYSDHDHLLSPLARTTIYDPANQLFLSAATIWEIAIKTGLGKLSLSSPYKSWINRAIIGLGLTILSINVDYADVQMRLPLHHRDPFDRMLVAQALAESMAIVSADPVLDQYGITRIW